MRISTCRGFAVLAVLCCATTVLRSHVIAEYLGGTFFLGGSDYIGQSFTTSSTDNYDNIAFNFFSQSMTSFVGNPYASGSGYLFSTPYTGPAGGNKIGAPGFLALGTASGGVYTFDSSLVLLSGTKYYFYTGVVGLGSISTGGVYAGGEGYVASPIAGNTFSGGVGSRNFRVTGTPVPDAVSTVLILGLAFAFLAGAHKSLPPTHTE